MSPLRSIAVAIAVVALALVLGASPARAQTIVEDQRLVEGVLLDGDRFGAAVDTSQGRMAVGAHDHDGVGLQSGSVFLYARTGLGWALEQTIQSSDLATNDQFGFAVSLAGERLLVGTPRRDVGVFDEGAVYVFERQGDGSWLELDRFNALGGSPGDRFGAAVALAGDIAVVGAPAADPGGLSSAGLAYVFERQASGDWKQIEKLDPPQPGTARRFGHHVEAAGPFVVVGQLAANAGDAAGASLFVFRRQGDDFVLEATLTSPTPAAPGAHLFGTDFDLDAPRLIVGDSAASAGGSAQVYERSGGTWSLVGSLAAAPEVSQAPVGRSVAIDDGLALLGGPGDANQHGRAALFLESVNGSWRELANVVPDDAALATPDDYARSIEMDADAIVVGAPLFDGGAGSTGAAFAFNRGMLMHGRTRLGIGGGAQQDFLMLAGPESAVKFHWLVGSATGTSPGVSISPSVLVPLVPDAYGVFTVFEANEPPLVGSIGLLDQDGVGACSFVVPPGLSATLAGLTLHHAYLVYDPFTLFIEAASNPVSLTLVP